MKSPIIVAHPVTGAIVTMFEGKDGKNYGRVRVDVSVYAIVDNMESKVRRSALITLTEDVIEDKGDTLKDGAVYLVNGQPGRLIVIESTTPFYDGQDPKTKGKGGEVITSNGLPVFRDTIFTQDPNAFDKLISSDRVEDVSEATAETQEEGANAPF